MTYSENEASFSSQSVLPTIEESLRLISLVSPTNLMAKESLSYWISSSKFSRIAMLDSVGFLRSWIIMYVKTLFYSMRCLREVIVSSSEMILFWNQIIRVDASFDSYKSEQEGISFIISKSISCFSNKFWGVLLSSLRRTGELVFFIFLIFIAKRKWLWWRGTLVVLKVNGVWSSSNPLPVVKVGCTTLVKTSFRHFSFR